MALFQLQFELRRIRLAIGDFVVGRSIDSGLPLDDAMISRKHAVFHVSKDRLIVEDLGSRNGVKVNHVRIEAPTELKHDDLVTVGSQQLQVIANSAPPTRPSQARTLVGGKAVEEPTRVGVRLVLVERAIRVGRLDEAEKILGTYVTAALRAGSLEPASVTEITAMILQIAAATRKPHWLERIFEVHLAAERVMPAATVDELHKLARACRLSMTPGIREYLDWMRAESSRMSPAERFAVQRMEGLARVLSA